MFPTFISILDIQSWWEVPSIAHFCSLFRTAFNLLDFDIEDLEEALLTDGTEESSWLQELIVRLLSGCLPNNEISTFNYQMFLRRLFRQKCQEHDRYNPFNTDIDFQILPLRTKVDILHSLCDFRLDADDVLDQLKNLEADSLRVEPLGYDANDSAYWYFYGTRLYREDYTTKNSKKKSVWQVICFTEDDWFQLTKKFKKSNSKVERQLHHTLSENFLPELPRLFKEKESLARKRLLENLPRRTSNRLRKLESDAEIEVHGKVERDLQEEKFKKEEVVLVKKKELENKRQEAYERKSKVKRQSEEDTSSEVSDDFNMAGSKTKKSKNRQRKMSSSSSNSKDGKSRKASKREKKHEKNKESGLKSSSSKPTTVGRQTNNSLSAATGQILIEPVANTTKKKLKTSQVFRQTDEDLQTGMHKILDYVKNHEDAWPFADPVEEEYAPNYYTVIRKPMDLQRMEERLDAGYYKSFPKFRADFQLIVDNCRLYNGAENEYTEMVDNLQQVFEKATEKYLDQISSSDDEIAIEFLNKDSLKNNKTKKSEEVASAATTNSRRKPMLAAQTDKKRNRSVSEESLNSLRSNSYESLDDEIETKLSRHKKGDTSEKIGGKLVKTSKQTSDRSEIRLEMRKEKADVKKLGTKKEKPDMKKEKIDSKKEKVELKKEKAESNREKVESKKEKAEPNREKADSNREKANSNREKAESNREKADSNREKADSNREKADSKREKADSNGGKAESNREKVESKKEKAESKKEKAESKKEKVDSNREKAESKKEKAESKKEKLEKRENIDLKKVELKKDKMEKKRNKHHDKKVKSEKKTPKESRSKSKKANKKEKKKDQERSKSASRSLSSPPPSDRSSPPPSWPPSSPDSRFDFMPKEKSNKRPFREMDWEDSFGKDTRQKSNLFDDYFQDFEKPPLHLDKKMKKDDKPLSPKPKDKHNKLRETIEKLKAKSEIKLKDAFEFELDHPKENKDKNKKPEKDDKTKSKTKEKPLQKSVIKDIDLDMDGNSTMDSVHSESKRNKKVSSKAPIPTVNKNNSSNMDALSIATEQTLKDINKWLDDTPKFAEFSSASNSPSYTGLDEFDALHNKLDQAPEKKMEKPLIPKKEGAVKDLKKRPFRDPSKFFKRREIQRTIDRLQPGKSKGNLISNVQNTSKADETYPLGPLSKLKDTKNSLIVKTDVNAPKLSLGSVLDSFGKHKFVDDQKKEIDETPIEVPTEEKPPVAAIQDSKVDSLQKAVVDEEVHEVKESTSEKETAVAEDVISAAGEATPNLSAWFKAFGAPKMQPPAKKSDDKTDVKLVEKVEENKTLEARKVPIPVASPNSDSPLMPHGQPIARQRKISTGSSMSERSSFSQDMDSPRVGMDERGAYPAPYPSPLHRSPSGASPIMASPRPDISPRSAAYPTINGQIRVGFYQDTVSNKSSPDKSCSPRENPPQSPYPHYSEHVYTPNTTENTYYNYANAPYYTHPPNYSSTNPTPPYNMEGGPNSSYYDTSKPSGELYANKNVQNYTANSPSSIASPHSPNVHQQQQQGSPAMNPPEHSSGVYSQHSPTIHPQNSRNIHSQSSPSMQVQLSPNVRSQNSPVVPHSPNVLVHSPNLPLEGSSNISAQSPVVLQSSPPEPFPSQLEEHDKATEKLQQQPTMFPVKKRAYNDSDLSQINNQRFEIDPRLTQQLEIRRNHQAASVAALHQSGVEKNDKLDVKMYVHQNIPDPKTLSGPSLAAPSASQSQAQKASLRETYSSVSTSFGAYGSEANFPLTIPTARSLAGAKQGKVDLSQYTNMGYTGPDVSYTRSLQQFGRPELNYTANSTSSSSQKLLTQSALTTSSTLQSDMSMRYGDPNVALSQMNYKGMELGSVTTTNPQQAHHGLEPARNSDGIGDQLTQMQEAAGSNVSRYNSSVDVGRSMASLSHIVDRFGNDERIMAGLQNTSSYFGDKALGGGGGGHIFSKPMSTSASALPILSQSNMSAMQSYSQNVQATTTSMYNRQMSELQNAAVMQNDLKTSQHAQAQEKKSKKRRSSAKAGVAASSAESQQQTTTNQGFQSYAGLKGTTSIEPSAISLKTSSVVPGSAFNFGPTPTGLGIGSGLYSDKDAYPNFLEEFRSAPNYYMAAAAAAHHRATPESSDKQTRPAHQSSNPQATPPYPFLGAPQATRSGYPIGGPFIPNASSQLMDTSSPLYQHYLQAGVLNQGLLGPHGAYPPGYHPALSMRQPYDSMTRPPWL